MKKLISLVLCVMMLASLFAMNASASVVTGANTVYLVNDTFEGNISEGYTFANVTEATEEGDNSYYEVTEWARAYAQPVAYPESGAYTIEFDSKFMNKKGNVAQVAFFILDKDATAEISDNVASSMDFYVRGDVNPEAKGIDTSKWYSFRVTIDKAAGITYNGFHGRLDGNGIKLEWKEKGATEWKTAVKDLYSSAGDANVETNFGGEDLKYYVGRNIWQYVNPDDMESDGFGIDLNSYLDNFKIRQTSVPFTGAKLGEDADGLYIYSDLSARPYLQPVNFPESGSYTIEFDSKFSSTADGAAQVLTVYLLDPALVADIADVASSIDFNIQGSTDAEAKGIDTSKWYSFKITIDKSKGIAFNGYYGRLQGNGIVLQWKERGADEWKTAVNVPTSLDYTGSDLKYYASRNYWQYVNGSDIETPGFGFQTRTYLDNLTISYPDPIPATGVLFTDDFEGATTFATGIASIAMADGNSYLALKGDGSSWAGSGQAIATEIPENFILTMDVYMEEDNAQNLMVEYWQTDVAESGVWGQVGVAPADVEAEKWYTLKIAKVGEGRTYTVSLEDKETGEVKAITPVSLAIGITGHGPGKFMFRGWLNGGIINWRVDNIVMTEAAAASLPAIDATGDAVAVTVSADAISETITPILALYNGGRLVDVDWDAKAAATEGVSAELTATGEYDEAIVFIWDGFENRIPLREAWDITDIIAE